MSTRTAELQQEPAVVFREQAQILHLILEVCDAFDTHAESESCIFLAVDAAGFKHVGVYHAAAEYLYPACTLAERTSLASAEIAGDIHLGRRLGEREIARTQTDFGIGTEHLAGKVKKRLTQVGKRDTAVHVQGFYLVEEAVGACRK